MPEVIASSLSALPLHDLISSPLTAAIDAQAAAALNSVRFIKSVGFDQEGKPTTIDFKYTQKGGDADGTEATLTVPFLTVVNIPFIRIQDMSIDFEFKIHQIESKDTETTVGVDTNVSASGGFAWVKAKAEIKASYSRKDNEKSSVDRSATLRVQLRATQDEMPAGLSEVLDILKASIRPGQKRVSDRVMEDASVRRSLGAAPTAKALKPARRRRATAPADAVAAASRNTRSR